VYASERRGYERRDEERSGEERRVTAMERVLPWSLSLSMLMYKLRSYFMT
jgi:hypothetical protein